MQPDKRLFLLDAYALIYRAYYGFIKNPRINSKGENTSAIFGFINTLEDLLRRENPTHLAICFDPSGSTFRHEAYEQYKAQREETPEVIRWSVPIIKNIVKGYNIPLLEVNGYEADDVIGTVAFQAEKEGYEVYMMTPDKDYGQLVTPHIRMYKPKFGGGDYEIMGPEEIKNKYSLTDPKQMIDLLGLMGDSSDNIPGCPGVGEVTAKKLIGIYGSIDALLENTEALKGSLKTKIEENRDLIKFSQFLATIKTDVPVNVIIDDLIRQKPDGGTLETIFNALEFKSLINRIVNNNNGLKEELIPKNQTNSKEPAASLQYSLWDEPAENKPLQNLLFKPTGQDDTNNSILKDINDVKKTYYFINNEAVWSNFIQQVSAQKKFCLDTETTGIDPISAELVGMSFSWKENEAWYLPMPENVEACQKKINELKPILENPSIVIIGQNIKYDLIVLKKYNLHLRGRIFDTMIAHYLLQPEQKHNMDYLAEIYLNYQTIHIEKLIGPKGKNQLTMRDIPQESIFTYAAEDADITFQLANLFEKELKENNLDYLSEFIEMPLVNVLAEMEYQGVSIDKESLRLSSIEMTESLSALETKIQEIAGISFNVNSPKQIGEVLFDKLKIDQKAKKTKTGQFSTSEETLERLKDKHPIVEKILEQRGLKKLLSTYIDALPLLINPHTGKIHTTFNQAVTATGRLSSSNPNLQNIPIRDEMGRDIRKAFASNTGSFFLSADYSQIELRLMAHLSHDPAMIEAFKLDQDIHTATAAKIFQVPLNEVTSDMRRKAKTANFGIIYGISVFGLAERMSVSRTEAKSLIDGYFMTYPLVKQYMESVVQVAKTNGWVETLFHRKRYLPDINSKNAVVRGFAERNAINAPIQGTAADIIKIAMVRIHSAMQDQKLASKMILQVHDELNFIVPTAEIDIMKQLVRSEMENAVALSVPLKADIGVGSNWLEAH